MTQGNDRTEALRRSADRLARRRTKAAAPDGNTPLWDASFFGLDRVARFRDANIVTQLAVLEGCAAGLLAESLRIERCGIDYCARMTLSAEGDDERRMFALIGADEALHASWLAPWIEAMAPQQDPFSRFIAGLAEAGNPQPLAYLLQVVLEGFGIAHYSALATHCCDTGLAATFKRMTQDEALHYAGGLAAFRAEHLTDVYRHFLEEAAYTFLQMIRCGPQGVVAAVDRGIGVRDQGDTASVFSALNSEAASAEKLSQLRRLMAQPGMEWLVDTLDRGGLFVPCTAVELRADLRWDSLTGVREHAACKLE